jgi:hypothetical protein
MKRVVIEPGRLFSQIVVYNFDELSPGTKRAAKDLCQGYPTWVGSRLWTTVPARKADDIAADLEALLN